MQEGFAQQMLSGAVDIFRCCIFTWDFLPVVLPAYLLAGAIVAFVPVAKVLRYLGYEAKRWVAYGAAVFAGLVIEICSCNIVPLAASIYRCGAGVGPTFSLLFAGPALNLVALVWTFQVFGVVFGMWRFMAVAYRRDEKKRIADLAGDGEVARSLMDVEEPELEQRRPYRSWFVLASLMAVLVLGAKGIPWGFRIPMLLGCMGTLVWVLNTWFSPQEVRNWLWETWRFMKMTLPVLIPAILIIAYVAGKVPLEWFTERADGTRSFLFLGDNSLRATTLASAFGSVMYFPILTEIPFVKAFLKQGMGVAPAMALLMGAPGISLPGSILIARLLGWKKMLTYVLLEITLDAGVAYAFGRLYGDYRCPCLSGVEHQANMEWVTVASGLIAIAVMASVIIAWRRQTPASTA